MAPTCVALTAAEEREDWRYGGWGEENGDPDKERDALKSGVRHRRDRSEMDELFFRRHVVEELQRPDGSLATLAFGVSKRAALLNGTAVNGRSTFHSDQRCVEQLCRQRTAKDYAYVTHSGRHKGFNDPQSYSVYCHHEKLRVLCTTGLEAFLKENARLSEEKEKKAKAEALQKKIEAGMAILLERRRMEEEQARAMAIKERRRAEEATVPVEKKRDKWQRRLENAVVLQVQGEWSMMQDSAGSVFYHCSDVFVPSPFSWDPPASWVAGVPYGEGGESGYEPSAVATSAYGSGAVGSHIEGVAGAEYGGDGWVASTTETGEAGGEEYSSTYAGGGAVVDSSLVEEAQEGGGEGGEGRGMTDEEVMAATVEQLASNGQLLEQLAWRLGIPIQDIRRDGREPPLHRGTGAGEGDDDDDSETEENRNKVMLESDDDVFSDSEDEAGDLIEPPGELVQDHTEARVQRMARRKRKEEEEMHGLHKQTKPPVSMVPPLDLGGGGGGGGGGGAGRRKRRKRNHGSDNGTGTDTDNETEEGDGTGGKEDSRALVHHLKGKGWRRVAGEKLAKNFLEKCTRPHTLGPSLPTEEGEHSITNSAPAPRMVGMTDPSKATKSDHDTRPLHETMFISDVVDEHAKLLGEAERRAKQEEALDDDGTPLNVPAMAAAGPQEFTSIERQLMAMAEVDNRKGKDVKMDEKEQKALIATKAGNLETLEPLLEDGVGVDTADVMGNTLLILAAQQGNKRMIKFLLRKGASLVVQNHQGNSPLHFCFSLGHKGLGEYLLGKGADDSLLNAEGLTCYEGLQKDSVDSI